MTEESEQSPVSSPPQAAIQQLVRSSALIRRLLWLVPAATMSGLILVWAVIFLLSGERTEGLSAAVLIIPYELLALYVRPYLLARRAMKSSDRGLLSLDSISRREVHALFVGIERTAVVVIVCGVCETAILLLTVLVARAYGEPIGVLVYFSVFAVLTAAFLVAAPVGIIRLAHRVMAETG